MTAPSKAEVGRRSQAQKKKEGMAYFNAITIMQPYTVKITAVGFPVVGSTTNLVGRYSIRGPVPFW